MVAAGTSGVRRNNHPATRHMALIGIGDIHGCAATLDALLEKLAPARDDHLVFVGDYIDRGTDSRGVIDRLLKLKDEVKCTFLRGNHEAMMLNYLDYGEIELWRLNGGLSTLSSYANDGRITIPDDHIKFVRETLLYHDEEDFFFVHAGLDPHLTIRRNIERDNEDVYLWERDHFGATYYAWEKPIVCGHTPHPRPVNEPRLICIDTGCVYWMDERFGKLTAVRLPEREMVMVPYR